MLLCLILIEICLLAKDSLTKEHIFRFSTWDFTVITKTTAFIDKTLLMKTLFEKENQILILAPRLSGKSTNLNMAKRFLEINVDFIGKPTDFKLSENYKLFVENNLKIYSEDVSFFDTHFGKYPLVFIDCYPLHEANNLKRVKELYEEILLNTFQQHEYLMNTELWLKRNESKELFSKYLNFGNFTLTESEIREGFNFLSKLLFQHFHRKVYILMDNYDVLVENPGLRESPEKDEMIEFVYSVNNQILANNRHVARTLVTGVVRQQSARVAVPAKRLLPDSVIEYNCNEYNCFSRYYGVTPVELDQLLGKLCPSSNLQEKVKSVIILKASATEQNNQIYSTWSVLRYLANLNATTFT